MSDDQQRTAEAIDPDQLGDDPTGDLDYPPERPMGVDNPTRDDRVTDDVATRAEREEPEDSPVADDHMRLVAPNDVLDDDVAEAIARRTPGEDVSAEEAAIRAQEAPVRADE